MNHQAETPRTGEEEDDDDHQVGRAAQTAEDHQDGPRDSPGGGALLGTVDSPGPAGQIAPRLSRG